MARYKFDQIAHYLNEKRMPTEADRETYIGLEHLDSGNLTVTRWGSDVDIKGQKLVMHKGDILFGRRNTYLKRAAIAPHDGLFSAHGMIWRPKEDIVDAGFFPFFVSSDYFMDEAIRISVGSLSPTINWRDLKELEFDLPDIDTQRKLSTLLWAMERAKTAYKNLIAKTDELVKSQFVEMFGDPIVNPKGYAVHQLSEHILFLTSGSRGWAKYYSDEGEWFITIKNVKDCRISVDDVQCIKPPQNAEAERTRLREGDLLISITADLGRTGVVTKEIAEHGAYNNQHLTSIRLDQTVLDPLYVAYFMESPAGKSQFESKNMSAVKAGLNFDSIRSLKLLVPPLELQKQFVAFVDQIDKSKFAAQQALADLTATQKALMRQYLG